MPVIITTNLEFKEGNNIFNNQKMVVIAGPEIAKIMGLPVTGNYMSKETGKIFGDISINEVEHKRPMLSAVAVSSVKLNSGKGFYKLARILGRLRNDNKNKIWKEELKKVYNNWK